MWEVASIEHGEASFKIFFIKITIFESTKFIHGYCNNNNNNKKNQYEVQEEDIYSVILSCPFLKPWLSQG